MQTRSSDENSLCLSLCPSNAWIVTKRKKKPVQIFTLYERTFSLVFWEKEWLVGATTSTWNFGLTGPRWSEIAEFQPIFARSGSAVKSSEKSSINTNRKSLYVSFRLKSHFAWRKSATKFLCVKTASDRSRRAFISLTNRAKIIVGGNPFHLKFWVKLTALERNCPFSIYLRL